jgi:hypothetical protein
MKRTPPPHARHPEVPTAGDGPPKLASHTRLVGAQSPRFLRSLDVFASRDDPRRVILELYNIGRPGGFGAAGRNRSGEARIFGAFLFENSKKVAVASSAVKNRPDSQISIADKCLKLSRKTLFEQNTPGKCQTCEYLTLLTTFARDKCCDRNAGET